MKQFRLHPVLSWLAVAAGPMFGAAVSTQWLAARVGYHPSLGEPLTTAPVPLYSPWNWFGWAAAALPEDLGLVLLTSLPFAFAVNVTALVIVRLYRSRPDIDSRTRTSLASEHAELDARPSDSTPDRTLALTLSDADVEVFQTSRPKTQLLDLDDIEEVFPDADAPFPASASDSSDASDEASKMRDVDHTVRADAPSYDVLQQLSAREHTDSPASETSQKQLRVDRLESEVAHDAPTAEAPARSLEHADTAEAPTPQDPSKRVELDPALADWAHEVATAEAPSPVAQDTGRFSEVATVEAEAAVEPPSEDERPPTLSDEQLMEEISRQLEDLDFDATSPEEVASALASLDVGPNTQKLGAAEAAALAQYAKQFATSTTASTGGDAPTEERPVATSAADAQDADDDDADNAHNDEEEWIL